MKNFRRISPLLLATTFPVFAQTSTTLYGILDAGLTYSHNTNGARHFKASEGVSLPNRVGIRTSEDLGGGMSALVQLEHGFNIYTGQPKDANSYFNRNSYLGLASMNWGKITLGRQNVLNYDFLTRYSIGSRVGTYAWHPGDLDRLAGTLRLNDSIRYETAPLGKFKLAGMYAFSQSPKDSGGMGKSSSLAAEYRDGPLEASAAYTRTQSVGYNTQAQLGTYLPSPFPRGPFVANSVDTFGAGLQYTASVVAYAALYTQARVHYQGIQESLKTIDVSAMYRPTSLWDASIGYSYSTLVDNKWNKLSAVIGYSLSKRTRLYVSSTYIRASADVQATLLDLVASEGSRNIVFQAGFKHTF